jgi:hypothetical protein
MGVLVKPAWWIFSFLEPELFFGMLTDTRERTHSENTRHHDPRKTLKAHVHESHTHTSTHAHTHTRTHAHTHTRTLVTVDALYSNDLGRCKREVELLLPDHFES